MARIELEDIMNWFAIPMAIAITLFILVITYAIFKRVG